MTARIEWLLLPAVLAAAPCSYAVEYFTLPQVQQAMFGPDTEFQPREILLTKEQIAQIGKAADVRVREPRLHVWEARKAGAVSGYLFVDEVYGKHEFITYAVALTAEGKVQGIQIMNYNETYGGEIRDEQWRAQFVGKQAGDSLKLNGDIRNIGGATLSCAHVTEGVRRLLASFAVALKSPA
jgi:Na+-translocating ferredoxin:NAD+ oxidoreductase RnfG subunit